MARKKTFIITVILCLVRFTFTFTHCLSHVCYGNLILFIMSQFSSFALDINRVWRFILLETVRYRLCFLRQRLEEVPECNYYLYISDNKTYRKNKMSFCVNLYRSIADIYDLVAPEIHSTMFVTVVCTVPKLINNFYHILLVQDGREPTENLLFLITHVLQLSFLLFSPCIIVEFHAMEVEKMRIFLIHRYIDELDAKVKEEIDTFLQYVNIRTFQRKIWRCVPMNIALPLEVANICVSAIIVIINFTHLYG
ncbi:uncharacterized protein LOC123876680 [Maniola jurtina]|uniref:uncharacterized protein LOC123876680 n=1 Tax=Maniola jurtina TaxID=191418 RepID=UPI001E68E2EC|nr:uncharacterized protein LOC123876680 [Maniola jurtina]